MFRKTYIIICTALLTAGGLFARPLPVEPRIAGLESNKEYMALLQEDARLQVREDSLSNAVERARQQLREDTAARQRYSQEILQLENSIFELRNAKGRLIDRINTIEQEWVLANLNNTVQMPVAAEAAVPSVPDSLKVRNLVDNLYFREHLTPTDYSALRRAQRLELQAADYVGRYLANHDTVEQLAATYAATQSEAEAMEIYDRYTTLQGLNGVLADSLSKSWNYIFDNKSYAYAYVLDKLGRNETLAHEEELQTRAAQRFSALQGTTASDAVVDYFLRKQVIVDYEKEVADVLGLVTARDSLLGVAAQLGAVDFRLPKVEIAQRSFLQYDSVAFSPIPKYTYQHPIPECKVYASGTIYRVLLGTFNTKRAAAVFRGTYPLFYRIDGAGKWCYFTGGFATKAEADEAQEVLKKHGFVRPEVVVWTDGVYRNLSQEPEVAQPAALYRIEITGTDVLSDEVKNVIAKMAGGYEISLVGEQMFVIGSFDDKAAADSLAAAIRQTDAALEIKVAEIAE